MALIYGLSTIAVQAGSPPTLKERSMSETYTIEAEETDAMEIPPLDQQAPELFDTATFGLG